jgi:hypothetical protein
MKRSLLLLLLCFFVLGAWQTASAQGPAVTGRFGSPGVWRPAPRPVAWHQVQERRRLRVHQHREWRRLVRHQRFERGWYQRRHRFERRWPCRSW